MKLLLPCLLLTFLSYFSAQASCFVTVHAGSDVTICSGSSITIGGSPTASGGSGSFTYLWTPSTGLNSATVANPMVTVYATATFIVTATGGCTNSDTMVVYVNPTPTLTTLSNVTICISGSTALNVSGANVYLWSPSTSLSATTGSSVTANPSSSKSYTITGTDLNGCSSSTSVEVWVATSLPINAGTNVTICKGATTMLSGSGATSYSWSPSTTLSSATIYNPIASPTVSTTYLLSDPNCVIFPGSSVRVTVSSLATFAVSPASTTICAGTPTTITAQGASSYSWLPSSGLNSVTGAVVITSATASITYTVTGMDGNGCTKSISASIATSNLPPVVTVSSNTTICAGQSSNLSAGGAVSYSWSPSTGLNTITGSVVTANPVVTDTYSVTGTTNCGSNTQTITISVSSLPTITISGPTSICKGSMAILSAKGAATYNWLPIGDTSASVTVNPTVTTAYTAIGISKNGCSNSSTFTLIVSNCGSSGIEQELLNNSFKLYPNPTNGSLTATFNTDKETSIVIRLMDMKGNEIYREFKNQFNGEYKTNIDLSKNAKGIYMLNVITDEGIVNKKIIVE